MDGHASLLRQGSVLPLCLCGDQLGFAISHLHPAIGLSTGSDNITLFLGIDPFKFYPAIPESFGIDAIIQKENVTKTYIYVDAYVVGTITLFGGKSSTLESPSCAKFEFARGIWFEQSSLCG